MAWMDRWDIVLALVAGYVAVVTLVRLMARRRDQADADTILFNTCSVRQHAEDKIYSALGRLKNAKREHPNKVIGVLGCMAQKDQATVFKRAPYVDLVVGPGQLHQVPALVREIRAQGAGRTQRMEVSLGRKEGSGEQTWRLSDLLAALHDIAGIERIKFVTNYPKDMTNDLLAAVRDLPKVSKYLHVPVQSGSNDGLRRMKGGEPVEEY